MTGAASSRIFARLAAYPARLAVQYPYHCHRSCHGKGLLEPPALQRCGQPPTAMGFHISLLCALAGSVWTGWGDLGLSACRQSSGRMIDAWAGRA
jgi:hypothetical protein